MRVKEVAPAAAEAAAGAEEEEEEGARRKDESVERPQLEEDVATNRQRRGW